MSWRLVPGQLTDLAFASMGCVEVGAVLALPLPSCTAGGGEGRGTDTDAWAGHWTRKEITCNYHGLMCSLHLTSGPDEVVNGHPWLLKPPLGQAGNVLLPQQGAELQCCVLQVGRLGHTNPDFCQSDWLP